MNSPPEKKVIRIPFCCEIPCSVLMKYVLSRSLDSWVHRSLSSSASSKSPNWFNTLPISPVLPTAFFTCVNPWDTTSLPPMIPATDEVALPRRLYVELTAFLPVANVFASVSTVSRRG